MRRARALVPVAVGVWLACASGTPARAAEPADAIRTGIVGLDRLFRLTPLAGVGWTNESGLGDPKPYYTVGLSLEVRPSFNHALLLSFARDTYGRTYIEDRLDPARGALGRTDTDEHKWSGEALYAYDLFAELDADRRFGGEVLVGFSLRHFDNAVHPHTLFAAAAGFRFSLAVTRAFDVSVQALYGYNLVPPSSSYTSFHGEPRAVISYGGSLGLRPSPRGRVHLTYRGETIPLVRAYRQYSGVLLAYDFCF